jgi:hypothetical protein
MLVESNDIASLFTRTSCVLQFLKHPVQHTRLGPATQARVDGVPVTKPLGQSAPPAAVFGDIQDSIDYLQVAQTDIAALRGQAVSDALELYGG